jgi:hypothetical protein
MLPQSNLLIMAPIASGRGDDLRAVLATMNQRPGFADPENALVPFGHFERLHLARFVILEDPTPDDLAVYGLSRQSFPPTLAFLADCDGAADALLAQLVERCEAGLRAIFAHCQGFGTEGDLLHWMQRHREKPVAAYVNWIGRTAQQIREEARLYDALSAHVDANAAALAAESPQRVRRQLTEFVQAEQRANRIVLSPPEPTPLGWRLRNLLNLVGVPLVLLLAGPLLLLYLPVFFWLLRRHETRDPEVLPRPEPGRRDAIAALEDNDVTNPYIVLGYLKPGWFRLSTVMFLLWIVDYGARHIYNRGHLGRVHTIHFARWVFLNNRRQMFFASNYDGSLDSYMDDFINKVAWGLNLLFSNGVGYPRTDWLLTGGASDEQKFKYYLFRHQLPIQVWYKAYPGLTAFDLMRNSRIREGIERLSMTDDEIREWLNLL